MNQGRIIVIWVRRGQENYKRHPAVAKESDLEKSAYAHR